MYHKSVAVIPRRMSDGQNHSGEGNVLGHWLDLEGTCPRGQEVQTLSLPFTCSSNSCHCSACCFLRISDAFSF